MKLLITMKYFITGLTTIFLLLALPVQSETVYIDDTLRVGLRDKANSSMAPKEVLLTGVELEVLGREGDYIRVRTSEGEVGWVHSRYIAEEPPAKLAIVDVRENLESLKRTYERTLEREESCKEELAKSQEEVAGLNGDISGRDKVHLSATADLRTKVEKLEAKLKDAETKLEANAEHWQLGILVALAVAALLYLIGFVRGAGRIKAQVKNKLGGLEV